MSLAVEFVMAALTGLTCGGAVLLGAWALTELLPSRVEARISETERDILEERR